MIRASAGIFAGIVSSRNRSCNFNPLSSFEVPPRECRLEPFRLEKKKKGKGTRESSGGLFYPRNNDMIYDSTLTFNDLCITFCIDPPLSRARISNLVKLSFRGELVERKRLGRVIYIYIYRHVTGRTIRRRVVIEASLPCNHKRESDCSSGSTCCAGSAAKSRP